MACLPVTVLFCFLFFFHLCCSAGQNLRFLLIPSAFCCGWHVSGVTRVAVRHPRCPLRWNQPSQISLAWLWPVFHNASQDAAAPTGDQRRIKQAHAEISLCSKYPLSTFYKCAVFIIRNPTTAKKKKSLSASLGERNGKWQGVGLGGWRVGAGINYLQTNLLFRHGARKTSVPAPPVIQEVLFFCSSLCFSAQMWK